MDVALAALAHTGAAMTPCTHTSKCKAFAHHAQTRIHAPGTAVASTGEYLAGKQHRYGRLAAASSDTAAAEMSNVKFVLPTPKARVWSWSLAEASEERFKLGSGPGVSYLAPALQNGITRGVLSLTFPRTPALSHNSFPLSPLALPTLTL